MATKISIATGNWTSAATWGLCDATSENDSEAANTVLTTSYVASSNFTPGAITIDAIAVKVASRAGATGTMSVNLRNTTLGADVAGTEVTINLTDGSGAGWHVFTFASPVLLLAATNYAVQAKSSSASQINLYSSATTNWTRQLRTTTTGAPAANDKLLIAGQYTGAGASNSYTVTMDETATTSYGPTVSGGPPDGISVSKIGTLTFGVVAATNYYLKVKGRLTVYSSGTLNIGTSGARMPSNSSAVLEFDSVTNVDSGLYIPGGGTFNAYGNQKFATTAITGASNATPIELTSTSHGLVAGDRIYIASVGGNTAANGTWEVIASTGSNTYTIGAINGAVGGGVGTTTGNAAYTSGGTWQRLPYTRLNADEVAGQTVIGPLLSTAGWAANDELCFASTTRTASECEKKTITTVDSATQVTLSAGLTNAHSGTSPTQAEVGNLTRNVKIRGVSASLQGYLRYDGTSVVVMDHVEMSQLGSATTNKRGIDILTTTQSCSISFCSVHDSTVASSRGFNITGSASSNITLLANVTFNLANTHFATAATSGTWTADGNLFVRCTDSSTILCDLGDIGGTFTNNTCSGATGVGLSYSESASTLGTFTGHTSHSNTGVGVDWACLGSIGGTGAIGGFACWRQNTFGMRFTGLSSTLIATYTAFGNGTANLSHGGCSSVTISGFTSNGDSTFSTTSGISQSANVVNSDLIIESGNFGTVAGIKTAHTQDLACNTNYTTLTLRNTILASSTEVATQTNLLPGSFIRSQKHDQTAGLHKNFTRYGTITIDTTLFDATPAVRLAPNNASFKLASDGGAVDGKGAFQVAVTSGNTVTVSVKVRESVVGDGTDYAGGRIRLIVRKNVAAGITADTVLATATVASEGAFETIQGTTAAVTDDAVLSFVVDCDGTTGWIDADTWTATPTVDSTGLKYWQDGMPFACAGGSAGGVLIPGGMVGGFRG